MRIVVFASGRGSNAKAIFELAQSHPTELEVVGLICDCPDAGVVEIAKAYAVPTFVLPLNRNLDRKARRVEQEHRIIQVVQELQVSYLCLAGYMRILSPEFIAEFPHPVWPVSRILNIHPSLLPAFKGCNGYADAFAYGVRISGITVHFVSEQVDAGEILAQEIFPRLPSDTIESFSERGLRIEHQLYPQVLRALSKQQYRVLENPFRIFLSFDG